jgi:hypothetical protein
MIKAVTKFFPVPNQLQYTFTERTYLYHLVAFEHNVNVNL